MTNREGQHIEVRTFQSDLGALKDFSGPVIEHLVRGSAAVLLHARPDFLYYHHQNSIENPDRAIFDFRYISNIFNT